MLLSEDVRYLFIKSYLSRDEGISVDGASFLSADSARRATIRARSNAVLVDSNAKSVSPNLSLSFEQPIGMHYQWF